RAPERFGCGVAIRAREATGPELHAAEPAHDDDRDIEEVRSFDCRQNRPASGPRWLARIRAARTRVAKESKCPAVMRRIEMFFLDGVQLREKLILIGNRKSDAQEIGAFDLVAELDASRDRSKVIVNGRQHDDVMPRF